jgi:outer membrane receptor protein involved in Fe transport
MYKFVPPFELKDSILKKTIAFGGLAAISSFESNEVVAAEEESNIEEIIVTATKRESRIEDLPMSVQAITGSRLESANVNDFMDYAELIPSLSYIQYGPGRSAFYIRGTSDGNFGNLAGPNTTVAMYIDESPINTVGLNPDLHIYDMERIEVLNGPQGTLYGSSAQGGTVKLITNKPERGQFDAGAELDFSSGKKTDPSESVEAFINIPISDNVSARVSGYDVTEAGFIDLVGGTRTFTGSGYTVPLIEEQDHNESNVKGYRASLRAWINDSLTATLTHINQESYTSGSWDHQPTVLGDLKSSRVIDELTDDEWSQSNLTIEGDLGNSSFTYAGTFFDRDVRYLWDYNDYVEYYQLDSTGVTGFGYASYYTCDYYSYYYYGTFEGACNDPTMWADYSLNMERETHELRFTGGEEGDQLQWLIGVFYDKLENPYKYTYLWPGLQSYYSDGSWGGTGISGREGIWWEADNIREDETKAIYGEAIISLNENTDLTLGLRAFDSKILFNAKDGYFGGFGLDYYGHEANRTEEDSGISPKIAISRTLENDALVYFNYSQGYRPAGTNRTNRNSDAAPLYYDSDELNNYEIGYKYANSDATLRFNTALYFMDWKDMQTAVYDRDLATIQFNTNIGDAEIAGLEFDLSYLAQNGFNIILGGSIIVPRLKEDFILSGTVQATSGTQLANVAKRKLSLSINREFTAFNGLDGYFDLNVSRTGERKSSVTNPVDQPRYTLANLSTSISSDNWEGVLYIDNLTDEQAVIWEYQGYRPETIFTNRPRETGLRLKYKF